MGRVGPIFCPVRSFFRESLFATADILILKHRYKGVGSLPSLDLSQVVQKALFCLLEGVRSDERKLSGALQSNNRIHGKNLMIFWMCHVANSSPLKTAVRIKFV